MKPAAALREGAGRGGEGKKSRLAPRQRKRPGPRPHGPSPSPHRPPGHRVSAIAEVGPRHRTVRARASTSPASAPTEDGRTSTRANHPAPASPRPPRPPGPDRPASPRPPRPAAGPARAGRPLGARAVRGCVPATGRPAAADPTRHLTGPPPGAPGRPRGKAVPESAARRAPRRRCRRPAGRASAAPRPGRPAPPRPRPPEPRAAARGRRRADRHERQDGGPSSRSRCSAATALSSDRSSPTTTGPPRAPAGQRTSEFLGPVRADRPGPRPRRRARLSRSSRTPRHCGGRWIDDHQQGLLGCRGRRALEPTPRSFLG